MHVLINYFYARVRCSKSALNQFRAVCQCVSIFIIGFIHNDTDLIKRFRQLSRQVPPVEQNMLIFHEHLILLLLQTGPALSQLCRNMFVLYELHRYISDDIINCTVCVFNTPVFDTVG